MSEVKEEIGERETLCGKSIGLWKHYNPKITGEYVPLVSAMKLITAAWIYSKGSIPMAPLLLGEAGVGKNRLIYELANLTGKDLYIFQGHEDVTAEDLACSVRFSDLEGQTVDYIASPLVTAMIKGGICFIDEIGKIRPRALSLLVSVLDERRYIDSNLLGGRVYADEGFRFIAATNSADLNSNSLPEFIKSRMKPIIKIRPPQNTTFNDIIKKRFKRINEGNLKELLNRFWGKWIETKKDELLTPRDAIHLFNLASSLADFDENGGEDQLKSSAETKITKNIIKIEPKHLDEAFNELFNQDLL